MRPRPVAFYIAVLAVSVAFARQQPEPGGRSAQTRSAHQGGPEQRGAQSDYSYSPETAAQPSPPGMRKAPQPAPPTLTTQTLDYEQDAAPTIYTKIRYGALIVLPANEKIVEAMCGDKDQWQIAVSANIAYVKPEKARINTNLTLIGASGLIYSFLLDEISDRANLLPHVRTTITARSRGATAPTGGVAGVQPMQFLSKTEVNAITQDYADQLQTALADARDARAAEKKTVEAAKATIDDELTRIRTTYPTALQFDYLIALDSAPFFVQAMFADDKFTYIRLRTSEAPAIYELKDGKPNLVNFDYVNGVYIIRKIVEQGYLVIGKSKLTFTRKRGK